MKFFSVWSEAKTEMQFHAKSNKIERHHLTCLLLTKSGDQVHLSTRLKLLLKGMYVVRYQ